MSRRRRKFLVDEPPSEEMSLQITSMADIFTIILLFLLKSFSTGITTIAPTKGMVLPHISKASREEMKEALKLEILPDAILIDQKQVMSLKDFSVEAEPQPDPANAGITAQLEPVYQALVREREREKSLQKPGERSPASEDATPPQGLKLLVMADERTPYSTLDRVMASAANAGYIDLQLVVLGAD